MKKIIRILLIISGIVLFGVFIAPLWAHILNIGNAVGIILSVMLILIGLFLNSLVKLADRIREKRAGRIIFNTCCVAVLSVLMSFAVALGSTIACSSTNANGQSTVIVLGCAVVGERPSWMLKYRINSACKYLEEYPDSVAVLSGGQGSNEEISEAQCMFNILTDMGIDKNRLYLEDKSTNTYENITFSKNIIAENNLSDDVAICSSSFHLKRATMIAEKQGLSAKRISAPTSRFLKATYFVRDALGVIKEFIFK